jgi:hypothetical protein
MITYYQKGRHIYGDLKIEIFDSQGKLMDTVSGSKHRGLNRTMWPMRLDPPVVPPAASAAFGAARGPLVLPGTYTVKMTKGDQTYTTKLNVATDPRANYTLADRKAQFELVMKLSDMLGHMSWAVDAIIGVRDSANQRAAKVAAADPLHKQLVDLATSVDKIRSEIVATKEGGAITGEERLREYVAQVYGDVNDYEGKPTDDQVARTKVLQRELLDVVAKFQKLAAEQLPGINSGLTKQNLPPIAVLTEADWQKQHPRGHGGSASAANQRAERFMERD